MVACLAGVAWSQELRRGDVVFIRSTSEQAAMIALATDSPWTHTGIVWEQGGALVVLEAVGPVRVVPLADFLGRAKDGLWSAGRPPEGVDLDAVEAAARGMLGRPYDAAFAWDDERLYCSELVVKAFAAGGLALGELRPVSSFRVDDPRIRDGLRARGIPADRLVVSPASVLADPDLTPLR